MGWLISIAMFITGCITGNDTTLLVSGLFAIAGSISFVGTDIRKVLSKEE